MHCFGVKIKIFNARSNGLELLLVLPGFRKPDYYFSMLMLIMFILSVKEQFGKMHVPTVFFKFKKCFHCGRYCSNFIVRV